MKSYDLCARFSSLPVNIMTYYKRPRKKKKKVQAHSKDFEYNKWAKQMTSSLPLIRLIDDVTYLHVEPPVLRW